MNKCTQLLDFAQKFLVLDDNQNIDKRGFVDTLLFFALQDLQTATVPVEPIILGSSEVACPYCPRVLKSQSAMRLHIRIHTGEKPFQCSHCSAGFTQKGNYTRHMFRVHSVKIEPTEEWNKLTWFDVKYWGKYSLLYLEIPKDSTK